MLQHDCTNIGLTFAFVTYIMALRGGCFDELNAELAHSRRHSNVNNQVPHDPSKRTMITLDGGGFTATTIRMIIYIFENMFNGSWTTWNEVNRVWEDCIRKLYPNLMSKAKEESIKMAQLDGVQFDGSDFSVLKPYNPELIKSTYWEDMIDRVWNMKSKLSKHCPGSVIVSLLKRRLGCLVLAYCCSKGRLVAVAGEFGIECVKCEWILLKFEIDNHVFAGCRFVRNVYSNVIRLVELPFYFSYLINVIEAFGIAFQ
nr:transposase, Ptta/En/Spm [Tanacetum cinerariifolium]